MTALIHSGFFSPGFRTLTEFRTRCGKVVSASEITTRFGAYSHYADDTRFVDAELTCSECIRVEQGVAIKSYVEMYAMNKGVGCIIDEEELYAIVGRVIKATSASGLFKKTSIKAIMKQLK
jgi:hypothetical protein